MGYGRGIPDSGFRAAVAGRSGGADADFSPHVLHDVRVRQMQMDELFALLSAFQAGAVSEAEAIECLEHSPSGSGGRKTPRASYC